MKILNSVTLLASALLLSACQKQAETTVTSPPQATVQLRDGTQASGTVLATSANEITLQDNKSTRTYEMRRVKSIDYDDPVSQIPHAQTNSGARAFAERDPVHDVHSHPTESIMTTKTYGLPVGTQILVRTEETIDSAKAVEGQVFAAEIARNVVDADGGVVIPKGANAQIVIKSARRGGRIQGQSDLLLDLKTVSIDGRLYRIDTYDLREKGRPGVGMNKRTAEFSGGGAGIGAIIGAIAGHGKGAAIGAGAGAGAGALTQIITRGESIRIPVESVLTFQLDREFRVSAAR